MSLQKYVSVDVERVDLYFKPQVLDYGDMQISVKSSTKLLSFLHSAQVQPESSSCVFNLLRGRKNYALTKATLKSKMDIKSTNYGTNTANLDIGWSDFDYATLQDMVIDNPQYINAELSVQCGIVYDIYAFSFIPVKNNHYQFNSADSPQSFNIRDTLKTIFESGNIGSTNRRLLDSFSLPMQFYNTSFLPDITNSINQFGFKASTKIDSSKANIPFQVGVHVPAFKLMFGHSSFNNQTNMNQYESPYVFESDETSVDLFNSELSTAYFAAKVSCTINGTTCSLIYPLSSMLSGMENGTAMATADFINDNNFISNFLGLSHKMMYKSYDESSTAATAMHSPARSLLESNEDFTEHSRSLALKKPTARPSKKPTKAPTRRPTKAPTFHPTRQVLPAWSNYITSLIIFDYWELVKLSLYYTDISARLKLNVGLESYKLVVADVQLSWTNEIPLITSSNVHVDILDGQVVVQQDLFLNEYDEMITNDVNLYIDSDNVFNLNMNGKYSNLNHDKAVSDAFLVQFHDIDITISNETFATGTTSITVDAKVDGYMAIDFKLNSPENVTVFTGVEWNFDSTAPQNYIAARSTGEFVNQKPSWDGESYFAYDPSLGSVVDPSAYSYYFNANGLGLVTSTVTIVESSEKLLCSVVVDLHQNYYWWSVSDYDYYEVERGIYHALLQEHIDVDSSDVVSTDIRTNRWSSPTRFHFNVYLSPDSSCHVIMSALKQSNNDDNSYFTYKNIFPWYRQTLDLYIDEVGLVTKYYSVGDKITKPFSYYSQGEGLYGADGATRFDITMLQNSVKIDNSTLTSFEGLLSADLNSNGFLSVAFSEYNDGHFNFNTSNEFTWDLTSTDGGIDMISNGTLYSEFDWNFDGEFKYLPNKDKNEYSLNFDLGGNTFTTNHEYTPDGLDCSASVSLHKKTAAFINNDYGIVKAAFYQAYQDTTSTDDLEVKFLYTNAEFWFERGYEYSTFIITKPVKSELECRYINYKFDKDEFLNLLEESVDAERIRRGVYYSSYSFPMWIKFRLYRKFESQEEMISHPFSIAQSLSGQYYDGVSDVVLTVSNAELTVNGNKYDYDGSILRSGDNILVGVNWMDQLQSYMQLGWNIDGENDRGTVSMEATTLLKNAFDVVNVASNGSLSFDYFKSGDDLTQFALVSAVEGHGVDYYKSIFSSGYWVVDSQPLTCKWRVDGVDDRLSAYSKAELSSALKYIVSGFFSQQGVDFLYVDAVNIDNFNDFYSLSFIIKPNRDVPNFNCNQLYGYTYWYDFRVDDLIYYLTVEVDDDYSNSTLASNGTLRNSSTETNDGRELAYSSYYSDHKYWYPTYLFSRYIDSEYTTACPEGSSLGRDSVLVNYYCYQCESWYWDYYSWDWQYYTYDCYCQYDYDYYYYCKTYKYVEFHEEIAHTLSFNIEAASHGALVGSIADNNWFCEVEEASLVINGNKAIDASASFYNIPPTVEPTMAPTNSMKPTNRPTISPYLKKISPTYKPTRKPTPFPTVSPTYFPTLLPTLDGTRYGDRTIIFNFNDKQNDIDIGAHGSYHGSSNDFSLVLKEVSMKVGNTTITENEIGGKLAYKIPGNGETGKILVGSWDDNGDTVIYNATNSIEWLVKDKKFYIGLGSSFTLNDVNLYDATLNSSVIQSPTDLLLGVGNALNIDDSKIYDINAVTQFFNYDNRPDRPTYKPTKRPTRKPTKRPTKKPSTPKPSRHPTLKPTTSWIKVPRPTKFPSSLPKPSNPTPQPTSPTCPEGIELANEEFGKCYQFYDQYVNMQTAQNICVQHGGQLVSIQSYEEHRFVAGLFTDRAWIGLTDQNHEGQWKWIRNNGSEIDATFTAWYPNEPSNSHEGGEHCVQMYGLSFSNGWNDVPCSDSWPFICEHEIISSPTASPTSSSNPSPSGVPGGDKVTRKPTKKISKPTSNQHHRHYTPTKKRYMYRTHSPTKKPSPRLM